MTFRRDLETWTANQVAVRALSDQAKAIRRLLRGDDVGVLGPVDSQGLPSELREVYPPTLEVVVPPATPAATWVCWPSSDGAVYGWGEPYENPPGVPVNPPLGTVQTSFSDTARIAREIDGSDVVTHGVNKIAAPRDWRDSNSRLVVSWDSGAVYSGGDALITGGEIAAACVRNPAGASELLWVDTSTNPWRVYAQPCTIVDDVVTSVTGASTYCELQNPSSPQYWSEFNDDATALIICSGTDAQTRLSDSFQIPGILSGQNVIGVREAETQDYIIDWTSNNEFNGERTYLIKSQYVAGVLKHCWARVVIIESIPGLVRLDFVSYRSLGVAPNNGDWVRPPDYYQADACAVGDSWKYSDFNVEAGYVKLSQQALFNIDVELSIDGNVVDTLRLAEDSTNTTSWCQGYRDGPVECNRNTTAYSPEPAGAFPVFPGPDGNPCPVSNDGGFCGADTTNIFYQLQRLFTEKGIYYPQNMIDLRTARFCTLDIGYEDVANTPWTKYFKVTIFRNGMIDSVTQDGEFGEADLPRKQDIFHESFLLSWLDKIANNNFPKDVVTTVGSELAGVSIDVSDNRSVFSAWGKSEADGQFKYVDFLENADIEVLLSIDGEPNPRIVIDGSSRYIGLLMQEP